jgi:hypothetical protein
MALAVNTCNSSAWVVALACSLRLLEEKKRKKVKKEKKKDNLNQSGQLPPN